MFFPFERSSEVLHTWSALLPTLPDELMSWASLMHFPPIPDVPAFARGRSFAVVMAAYLGSEAEGRALLRPLRELGPERDTFAMVPPVVLGDLAMDPLDPVPFHLTHQLARPAAGGDDRRADGEGRARLGPRPDGDASSSSATWAARWRARRPAPAPARRCPARSA